MANGLLRRIYLSARNLTSKEQLSVLVDPELQKVRSKIEKSFPEFPDLTKVIIFMYSIA